jgi:alkylation response protein AidB-like acyl-CoA dehydrogenase
MDDLYALGAEALSFADAASKIAREVLVPQAPALDAEARFPDQAMAALGDAGLLGLTLPTAVGGAGQGPRAFAACVEELARGCASTAMVYVMHVSATQAIAASATLARRDALLRDIASGRHLTTLAFSERGSRSQFWAPVSTLEPAPGGGFVTSADKSWITSAGHADSYVSSGRASPGASPLESTIYLVRARAAGVTVVGRFDGLGLRGNDSAPARLERYALPPDDLLSGSGQGAKTMLEIVLPWFCIGTAAMAGGICLAAVEATAAHLRDTHFEHTKERLRDLPTLRARLATMSVRTEAARALLAATLASLERPSEVTPLRVLQTRLVSLEAALEVTDLAMKAGGGAAFSRQLPLERLFRDARAGWVMAPTVDHLQDFVGRALTGMPLL